MPRTMRTGQYGRASSRDSQNTENADKSRGHTLYSRNPDTTAGIARWGTAFVAAQYLVEYPLIAIAIVKRGGSGGGTEITSLAELE